MWTRSARAPVAIRPISGGFRNCRIGRGHAQRLTELEPPSSPGIAPPPSCRGRSRRACRPPAPARRPAAPDGAAVEVILAGPTHRRHRIGHQEDAARLPLGAQRDADRGRMHMMAVGDQAAPQLRRNRARAPTMPGARWRGDMALKRCVSRARRHPPRPRSDRRSALEWPRLTITPPSDQAPDDRWRQRSGRYRDEQRSIPRRR